jgi:hypothetical protein
MGHSQHTLRRYADKTEVDPMKLTLSAGLCALVFAGASLVGHRPSPLVVYHCFDSDDDWCLGIRGTWFGSMSVKSSSGRFVTLKLVLQLDHNGV